MIQYFSSHCHNIAMEITINAVCSPLDCLTQASTLHLNMFAKLMAIYSISNYYLENKQNKEIHIL